ncbi:MAG: hypothetical protein WD025_07030 [Bacteriovoracaceae bacterium]
MKNLLFMLSALTVFVACSKGGDDRLAEQANIEAKEQYEAQNQNQRFWAEKMENDLNKRKRFISGIEGEFFGEVEIQDILFNINAQFVSSIPIEFPSRFRTLDEINFELQNLNLNLYLKLENPRVMNSAVTCVIEGYRPNVKEGLINIISESWKNTFHLAVSETMEKLSAPLALGQARVLSDSVVKGEIENIDILDGVFESSVSSKKYTFKLRRQ